ncbi:MAG: diacylglycerol kinase [Planctomycetota bacterium]
MSGKIRSVTHWRDKFRNALRGIWVGSVGETSCVVHLAVTLMVMVAAWLVQCSLAEWCTLLICIGLVYSIELVKSAMEKLAAAVCSEENAVVRDALDIASGAVLVGAGISVVVGSLVLGNRLWSFLH